MAVALPREPLLPPRHQRARGEGRISAAPRDGRTRLRTLYQDGCAKIRLPNAHGHALEAVLINTAGGLCGGDVVNWGVEADAGASMVLTTQACERVYRSTGPVAAIESRISVGPDAHVDWLPQETILFEDARLDRSLEIDLAPGASVCAIEAILLGREAMGEGARNAHLRDRWRIRRDGRLVHAEATLLSADALERDGLSLLDGAIAFATIVYVGKEAPRKLDAVRAAIPDGARAAASLVGEKLILRALAPSGLALRRIIAATIAIMSGAGSLPRLWHL